MQEMQEMQVQSLHPQENPLRRKWQPLPVVWSENPMDRGPWRVIVHGVAKESDTTEQQGAQTDVGRSLNEIESLI